MHWTEHYRKAVTFSYDDGNEQDIRLLELFNRYAVKGTFNLNSGLGSQDIWQYKNVSVRRLNLPEAAHFYAGHEIAVHGSLHRNPTELSPKELHEEFASDKVALTCIFGKVPLGMAYAYGCHNAAVVAELQRLGIRYARTVWESHNFDVQTDLLHFRPTCHHDDAELFTLVEQFLASQPEQPQIFCIWGHSYELDGNHNWDRMERLLDKLAGKSDIFYGTNAEILL